MKKAKSTASTSPNMGSALTTKRPSIKLGGGRSLSPSPLPPPHHVPPANEQTNMAGAATSAPAFFCVCVLVLRPRLRGVVLGAVSRVPRERLRARGRACGPLGRLGALEIALVRVRSDRKADWPPRLMARKPSGPDGPRPALEGAANYSAAITKSAHRSPIIMLGALVLPLTILGITLASATHSPSSPLSLSVRSTTAFASAPMRQVPTGW